MPFMDIGIEEWRPVIGWDGIYEVSSAGRVRSVVRSKRRSNGSFVRYGSVILAPSTSPYGYLRVAICDKPDRPRSIHPVHRLVAEAFVDRPSPSADTINHINGDKRDNRPINLEWVSRSQNSRHGWQTGLMRPSPSGERHSRSKLTNAQAAEVLAADCSKRGEISAIARRLGVSISTISLIRKGRRYAV